MPPSSPGSWIGGLAEWVEGDTAYLSVAFTWKLDEAYARALWYRSLGFTVRAGGPGIFTRKHYLADVAEIGGDYPDAVVRHNPAATIASRGCPVGCWFCLPPDNLIVTGDGMKRIADIAVGELVLTHLGRYRPVTDVMSRPYAGPLVQLNSGATSRLFPTHLTPEHPVNTRMVSMPSGVARLTKFEWTPAEAAVPQRSRYARDVFSYPRTAEVVRPDSIPGLPGAPLTEAFMALLGWYTAEGYVTSAPGRGYYRVTFCLGFSDAEQAFADSIVTAAQACGYRAVSRRMKIGYRVLIHNVALARWLIAQIGTGATEKRLPLWLRLLPADLLQPFIAAWADGDGWKHLKKGTETWRITTVSLNLANGLREIALKLGFSATINRHHENINGRRVRVHDAFTVIFHHRRKAVGSLVGDERNVYTRIREFDDDWYSGPVYNLEVAEDNSYCTPAFAVHNCIVPKMEGRAFTLLPDFPVRPVLCDNNLSALPDDYQDHIVSRYRAADIPLLDANSGFEPRTFDETVYQRWKAINRGPWRFAYDDAAERQYVEPVMRMLRHVPARKKRVYVLIGNEPMAACLERIKEVIAWGGEPHAQPYIKLNALERRPHVRFDWTDQALRDMARWANRYLWKYSTFDQYRRSAKTSRDEGAYDARQGMFI